MRLMGVRITAEGEEGERKAPIPLTTQFQFPHARINSTQPAYEHPRTDQGKEGQPTNVSSVRISDLVRQTDQCTLMQGMSWSKEL